MDSSSCSKYSSGASESGHDFLPAITARVPSRATSDDDSLDDQSCLEDFQSVTLKLNDADDDDDLPQANSAVAPCDNEEEAMMNGNDIKKTNEKTDAPATLNIHETSSTRGREAVVKISITPNTPPSPSLSPDDDNDGQSTVSLNSPGGSPLFQSQKYRGNLSSNSNSLWRPQSPMPPKNEFEAKEFFAYRDSVIQSVIDEVQKEVVPEIDGSVHNTFLLTEIDHWDNEKERIVVLCDKSIVVVKYDFIAMAKADELRRIPISSVDKIVQGDLKYPEHSLAPRLNGIAGGVVGLVKDCVIPKLQGTVSSVGNAVLRSTSKPTNNTATSDDQNQDLKDSPDEEYYTGDTASASYHKSSSSAKTSILSALKLDKFEPRVRNVQGIRIMWNQDMPVSFSQKWNPFTKTIPWITFTSHPLLWHKGGGGMISQHFGHFGVDSFSRDLIDLLSHTGETSPLSPCRIEYKPIVIETYVGLASLVHNANDLGFYKIRGKISF